MSWPIEHFHYIPAPSSFIEMMPGAMKAMTQCAGVRQGEKGLSPATPTRCALPKRWPLRLMLPGGIPSIITFPPTGAHGAQVPRTVVGACANSDVLFESYKVGMQIMFRCT